MTDIIIYPDLKPVRGSGKTPFYDVVTMDEKDLKTMKESYGIRLVSVNVGDDL